MENSIFVTYKDKEYEIKPSYKDISRSQKRPEGEIFIDATILGFEVPLFIVLDDVKGIFIIVYQANPETFDGIGLYLPVAEEDDVFDDIMTVLNMASLVRFGGEEEEEEGELGR